MMRSTFPARTAAVVAAIVVIAAILIFAAGQSKPTPTSRPSAGASESAAASGAATASSSASPSGTAAPTFARNPAPIESGKPYEVTIDPANFVEGIDHPFFPLPSGSTFVYDGDEHIEVKVLDEAKEILGVKVTVVSDKVTVDGQLAEDTRDWYAQDRQGNVWYMGEQTAEYENGAVTSTAGSWEAGVDGAQPGIVMLADPQIGDTYRQEFLEGEAEDIAEVVAVSGEITTKAGSWSGTDVLVTEEWTPLEPEIRERKTYARGVGLVETRQIEGGNEVTSLTSYSVGAMGSAVPVPSLPPAFLWVVLPRLVRGRRPGVRSRGIGSREARGLTCRGLFEGRCCRRAGPATRSR